MGKTASHGTACGEREDICETLVAGPAERRRELLQTRLRKIDDALDRLMAGSYGHCSGLWRAIDGAKLEIDPALARCGDCRNPKPSAAVSGKDEFASDSNDVLLRA